MIPPASSNGLLSRPPRIHALVILPHQVVPGPRVVVAGPGERGEPARLDLRLRHAADPASRGRGRRHVPKAGLGIAEAPHVVRLALRALVEALAEVADGVVDPAEQVEARRAEGRDAAVHFRRHRMVGPEL